MIQNQKQESHSIHSIFYFEREISSKRQSFFFIILIISIYIEMIGIFWDGRIRTSEYRDQNPLPYHLATPHLDFCSILLKTSIGIDYSSIPVQKSMDSIVPGILTRVDIELSIE